MPTKTYKRIATTTLSSAQASVLFSSISGYTDIRAVVVTAVNTETYIRFNSDAGTNYSSTEIWGPNGSSANSQRESNVNYVTLRNSSSSLGYNMSTADIMNYSNSNVAKTVLISTKDGLYNRVYRRVALWRNTSPITTIAFVPDSGNFPIGSTFTLYGIE